MKYVLTIFLFVMCSAVKATPLEECISARLVQIQEDQYFSRTGKVRCEGAGFFEGGKFRQSSVCFNSAPGWMINGNAKVRIVSDNRGRAGQVDYGRNEMGDVTQACVEISCKSPSQPFGPGAWMAIELSGSVKKILTEDDKEEATEYCLNALSN